MRMISGFGYRNPEGYPDPTAYSAINNVEKAQIESKTSPEDEERLSKKVVPTQEVTLNLISAMV